MKILLTGAGGLLGQDIWKLLEKEEGVSLFAIGRTQPPFVSEEQWISCDLSNAARTYSLVTKCNPEVIIHCAAYNAVDKAESEPEEAFRGNALVSRNLALAAQRFDATLLCVSTDYVFSGDDAPATGYREFDVCKPINQYGHSKHWAEQFVKQLLTKFFIVRTSWLFGPGRPTWVDQVADSASQNKPIFAVSDMISVPTYTPDLAGAIVRLAQSRHYGTYHLTNSGFCSRAELAQEVLRQRGLKADTLQIMTRAKLQLPALRPAFSGLDNLAWRLDGFTPLRSWKDALSEHMALQKARSR